MKRFFLIYVILLSGSAMALLGLHFANVLAIPPEYIDKLIGLAMLPYLTGLKSDNEETGA